MISDNFVVGDNVYLSELQNFFFTALGMMSITHYGCCGDGKVDNYGPLQVAIDDTNKRHLKFLYVPYGRYRFRGELLHREGITFIGNSQAKIFNDKTGEEIPVEQFGYYGSVGKIIPLSGNLVLVDGEEPALDSGVYYSGEYTVGSSTKTWVGPYEVFYYNKGDKTFVTPMYNFFLSADEERWMIQNNEYVTDTVVDNRFKIPTSKAIYEALQNISADKFYTELTKNIYLNSDGSITDDLEDGFYYTENYRIYYWNGTQNDILTANPGLKYVNHLTDTITEVDVCFTGDNIGFKIHEMYVRYNPSTLSWEYNYKRFRQYVRGIDEYTWVRSSIPNSDYDNDVPSIEAVRNYVSGLTPGGASVTDLTANVVLGSSALTIDTGFYNTANYLVLYSSSPSITLVSPDEIFYFDKDRQVLWTPLECYKFDDVNNEWGIYPNGHIENSLTNDRTKIPTSQAVYTAIQNISPANPNIITCTLESNVSVNWPVTEYHALSLAENTKVGSKLSVDSNGAVVIGSGVSHVKVSGQLTMYSFDNSTSIDIHISKNNTKQIEGKLQKAADINKATLYLAPYVVAVSQGDVIALVAHLDAKSGVIDSGGQASDKCTYLTVEVID